MRIDVERLEKHLSQGLAPIYLLTGDEPLLVEESADAIRRCAHGAGYTESQVFTVESGFDWNNLLMASQSLSLFAERRVLELRLPTGKPGEAGGKALAQLAAQPPADTLLLVVTGKLDKGTQASAWVKALEGSGVMVQAWPLPAARLPAWISARLQARGLQAEAGVAELLAYHMEGNLLAAAQEVDKLALLFPDGEVRMAEMQESLTDSARFNVFALVDSCLVGDAAAVARMLNGLRAEGLEPILVLWALARELRSLAQFAQALAEGQSQAAVLGKVWAQRRPLVQEALGRLRAGHWWVLLARAARIDRVIKGRAVGDAWQELLSLSLAICGIRPLPAALEA